MRIGMFGGVYAAGGGLEGAVDGARQARDDGFASFWLPQIFGLDALTALTVIGREVPDIQLGTAVVPTYPRHPMVLAAQALTATEVVGDRLTLGIGLSHRIVIEHMFGYSFEKPLRHMREYLDALMPLLQGEASHTQGESVTSMGQLDFSDPTPPQVMVAALGPGMLRLAGRVTDGTITWMTGPETLRSHTVPTITAAASDAGRPEPRIAAGIPVCVTDDEAGARARAATEFAIYGTLPSYKAMLDREGVDGPEGIAVVGSEDTVREGIERFAGVGVTDFAAVPFGDRDDRARTRELLVSML